MHSRWKSYLILVTCVLQWLCVPLLGAAPSNTLPQALSSESAKIDKPKKKKNFLWPPLYSAAVPGLDQWIRKEWTPAAAFSGTALVGYGLLIGLSDGSGRKLDLDSRNDRDRWMLLGAEMTVASGLLSARHAFRYAVDTRPEDFPFLETRESDLDILKSPIQFEYLARPTTFLPLLILSSYITYEALHHHYSTISPTGSDFLFSGALSYGAGTGEEAFFRGYLMPISMYYTTSPLAADAIQGVIFAAAHGLNLHVWPQLLFGLYAGWLCQHNQWALSEGIFLHAWWDVIAFMSSYVLQEKGKQNSIYLTPISLRF